MKKNYYFQKLSDMGWINANGQEKTPNLWLLERIEFLSGLDGVVGPHQPHLDKPFVHFLTLDVYIIYKKKQIDLVIAAIWFHHVRLEIKQMVHFH